MRLPILVSANPQLGFNNKITISQGRWRIEFSGETDNKFSFTLISPAYPEGFEVDLPNSEFYVGCATTVICRLVERVNDKKMSIHLRRIRDGVQHFSNEVRA